MQDVTGLARRISQAEFAGTQGFAEMIREVRRIGCALTAIKINCARRVRIIRQANAAIMKGVKCC